MASGTVTVHRYDTIIVGAGGAGMRAALEAGQRSRTAVLTKLYPTRSHTGAAQGGMCAALANVEEDNWEWHTFDTVKGGDYLVDQDAAEVMCTEAIDAVLDLEKMGLPFNRTPEGRIDQRRFGGHTRNHGEAAVRRSCFAADRTGHMILQTLYQQCVKHDIEFYNEFYVLDLLLTEVPTGGGRTERVASGVVAYELATGEVHVFQAKAVLLATGGFGKVFKVTSNAHTLTGDGMGIVLRQGLPLEDMEFYQFHPTGIAKMGILLSEAARGEGGILRNKDGERFMERYAPTIKDLARTYLGIEPYTEPIPIQPTAHYAMGGVPTDIEAQVLRDNEHVVPGLYAAGEVACVSVHGANRLGTNSLLDINVFGRRGGLNAAAYANSHDFADLPPDPARRVVDMLAHLRVGGGTENVAAIRKELQETMDVNAMVFRTEATLKQAEADIVALKERYRRVGVSDRGARYNTELLEAVELGFLLDLAEALVVSAKARNESRGGHFREDFASRDDVNFLRHTMAYQVAGPRSDGADAGHTGIRLDYKPVVQTRYVPMERKY